MSLRWPTPKSRTLRQVYKEFGAAAPITDYDRRGCDQIALPAPDNSDQGALPGDDLVACVLRPALPFPALWYGISYV